MNLQVKELRPSLGLYVHVPFCASTCDFCGFYQKKPRGDDFSRYLEGVRQEWMGYPEDLEVETVFWGGGTPGLLTPRDMEVLGCIIRRDAVGEIAEWTVEMAPAFVTDRKLEALRTLGVNRISLGVQSFDGKVLDALGRQHRVEQIYQAVDRVRAAGFTNLNIDLIFAAPGQTEAQWEGDLRAALELEPAHVSTYCLTFEEDTALYVKLSEGMVSIDEEREADFYVRAWQLLEEAGYRQYEVSNFCRTGYECRHNLNTWRMGQWVGLGPAAASQYVGQRYTNVPDLERWLSGLESGCPERVEVMPLSGGLLAQDAMVFGLRMNDGIHLRHWLQRFRSESLWEDWRLKFEEWRETGLIEDEDFPDHLRLTLKGRLLADRIGAELLQTGNTERDFPDMGLTAVGSIPGLGTQSQ